MAFPATHCFLATIRLTAPHCNTHIHLRFFSKISLSSVPFSERVTFPLFSMREKARSNAHSQPSQTSINPHLNSQLHLWQKNSPSRQKKPIFPQKSRLFLQKICFGAKSVLASSEITRILGNWEYDLWNNPPSFVLALCANCLSWGKIEKLTTSCFARNAGSTPYICIHTLYIYLCP